jgi:hypothetical protein
MLVVLRGLKRAGLTPGRSKRLLLWPTGISWISAAWFAAVRPSGARL